MKKEWKKSLSEWNEKLYKFLKKQSKNKQIDDLPVHNNITISPSLLKYKISQRLTHECIRDGFMSE